MTPERYTTESVRAAVMANLERLFAPWAVGRPTNWRPDPATKEIVSLGYFLEEELVKLGTNDVDRKEQLWKYNRHSRTYDPWETAAECLNQVLDGTVLQGRKPHRRWG